MKPVSLMDVWARRDDCGQGRLAHGRRRQARSRIEDRRPEPDGRRLYHVARHYDAHARRLDRDTGRRRQCARHRPARYAPPGIHRGRMSERFICRPAETIGDMRRIVGPGRNAARGARCRRGARIEGGRGLCARRRGNALRDPRGRGLHRRGRRNAPRRRIALVCGGAMALVRPDAEHFAEPWFYVVKALRHGEPTTLLLEEAQGPPTRPTHQST